MSAIWGVIYNDKMALEDKEKIMQNKISKRYKIDYFDSIVKDNMILCCGHQFITKESYLDKLPDFYQGYYYTADVVLDNRDELIKELGISPQEPDGKIIIRSFIKWGEKMTDYIRGVFSILLYSKEEDTIWLFTDHTASRCVNYYINEEGFYFGTTIGGILSLVDKDIKLCEKWIDGYTSNTSADLYVYDNLTPFEDIYQLEAGHYIKIKDRKVKKKSYWKPYELPPLDVSVEQGIEMFRKTFSDCVNDALRSAGETGILLSSGLDSTSVAAVASKKLAKRNQNLYSYTSIPIDEFEDSQDVENRHLIPNETPGVKLLTNYYPNIIPTFVDAKDKDTYTDLDMLIPILECPYKSGPNLVWINEIYKIAKNRGCSIILKGQYGNATISYGSILTTIYQLLAQLKIKDAVKEITQFGKINHVSRRKIINVLIKEWHRNKINRYLKPEKGIMGNDFKRKYRINKKIRSTKAVEGGTLVDTRKQRKGFLYSLRVFEHLGAFDTRMGLMHGLLIRDPTKDKRMIELCMRLPIACFASEGVERKLVRVGLSDLVPREIRMDLLHRGWQGADYILRIKNNWSKIEKDALSNLQVNSLIKYVDKSEIEKVKNSLADGVENMEEEQVRILIISAALAKFIKIYEKGEI